MKFSKLFLFFLLIFAFAFPVNAQAASLLWDASTGTVDGYKVYYWNADLVDIPLNAPIPVADLIANPDVGVSQNVAPEVLRVEDIDTIFHLPADTRIAFTVSAYNTAGESDACTPVIYTSPSPPAPYSPATQKNIFDPPPEPLPSPESTTATVQ